MGKPSQTINHLTRSIPQEGRKGFIRNAIFAVLDRETRLKRSSASLRLCIGSKASFPSLLSGAKFENTACWARGSETRLPVFRNLRSRDSMERFTNAILHREVA